MDQACSKFIVQHQSLHDRIGAKLVKTIDAFTNSKAKLTVLYLAHDVLKTVRANYPHEDRNAKMHESLLVRSIESVLFELVERIPSEAKHHNVRFMSRQFFSVDSDTRFGGTCC